MLFEFYRRFRAQFWLVATCLLTLVVYSNTWRAPFVLDDYTGVAQLAATRPTFEDVVREIRDGPAPNRPVANFSFALNAYAHGLAEPVAASAEEDNRRAASVTTGYHAVNILFHLLAGVGFYLLTVVSLRLPTVPPKLSSRPRRLAVLIAALWLLHPVQVQSVTYIVQRMTVLSAMFSFWSLYLYVLGRLREDRRCLAAAAALFLLALGSKETAVILPAVAVVYELTLLETRPGRRFALWTLAAAIVMAFFSFIFIGGWSGIIWHVESAALDRLPYRSFSLYERLITQPRIILFYLSLLLFPHPSRLSLEHEFALSGSLLNPPTMLTLLFGGLILAYAVRIRRKKPIYALLIFATFLSLLVESSFVNIELVFEHRLYLPSAAVIAGGALTLATLLPVAGEVAGRAARSAYFRRATAAALLGMSAIVVLAGWSHQRNEVWTSEVLLWRDAVRKAPRKARPRYNLAQALHKAGRFEEAEARYREALRINPGIALAWSNLGLILEGDGREPEALSAFRRAVDEEPALAEGWINLCQFLARADRLDEALPPCRRSTEIGPEDPRTWSNLGAALLKKRRPAEALRALNKALRLDPGRPAALFNASLAAGASGDIEASRAYAEAFKKTRRALPGTVR